MKLKSVESLIKNNRSIQIRTQDDVQWLGDGSAFYPLHGFPQLSEDTIFRFFDIPEDKQGKYTYQEGVWPPSFDLSDSSESDRLIERAPISIYDSGMKLLPLYTSEGTVFINEKYLGPFADAENGVELYERYTGGQFLIAVKTGFLLVGLIAPLLFHRGDELKKIVEQIATAGTDDTQTLITD